MSVGLVQIDEIVYFKNWNKLKEKQLPLLYSKECLTYLKSLNLISTEISQQLFFKAQLFVPLKDYGNDFPLINSECINGFYINIKELNEFNNCKFHIPNKHNWLVKPHTNIGWLGFTDFIAKLQIYLNDKKSPLCWLKKSNGELF